MSKNIQKVSLLSTAALVAVFALIATTSGQANAATTSVNSSIGSIISLFTTSGSVAINATPSAGGVQTIANDVVTVSTNDSAGYTLKLGETTASSALVAGGNSIVASSGTLASPVAQSVNSWGYRVDSIGGFGAGPTTGVTNAAIGAIKFAAIPATATPDTIKTTAATASSDTTNVWYGVAVNTATPSGSYTNSVTYTAIAN